MQDVAVVRLPDLNYTVALTCASPPKCSVKHKVPKITGVTWVYWRHEFQSDGWLEYVVGGVLDQEQMDAFMWRTGVTFDCDTGGMLTPEGFKKSWIPAGSFVGDDSDYRAYICPFPAGLQNHDAYKFKKFEHHIAYMKARYGSYRHERHPFFERHPYLQRLRDEG